MRCLVFHWCLNVSCFKRKRKIKPFESMKETGVFVHTFRLLGGKWNQTKNLFQQLEKLVCCIFGQRNVSSVNAAHFSIFQTTGKFDSTLPLCQNSLWLHSTRANTRLLFGNSVFTSILMLLSPKYHGWKCEDQRLVVQWSSLPTTPSTLGKIV